MSFVCLRGPLPLWNSNRRPVGAFRRSPPTHAAILGVWLEETSQLTNSAHVGPLFQEEALWCRVIHEWAYQRLSLGTKWRTFVSVGYPTSPPFVRRRWGPFMGRHSAEPRSRRVLVITLVGYHTRAGDNQNQILRPERAKDRAPGCREHPALLREWVSSSF